MAINPKNNDLYFTDPIYGRLQDFRPPEALPHQVYRYNDKTGAVTVVADGFRQPNGMLLYFPKYDLCGSDRVLTPRL